LSVLEENAINENDNEYQDSPETKDIEEEYRDLSVHS